MREKDGVKEKGRGSGREGERERGKERWLKRKREIVRE